MEKGRILIVEDDAHISKLVAYNLEKAGFACTTTITGEEALEILDREAVDLIILDIMLPTLNGLEVCKQIKQDKELASMPIIMLTAKGEEIDRIVGFELGADDYIVKPFSPRELVLRVKAILKRKKPYDDTSGVLTVGALTVDIARHKVTVNKKNILLTPLEFELLVTLIKRQGRVQSRERLLDDVWDISADVTTRTVDTHIKRVREKLGRMGKTIETVRGIGYRFNEEA